MAELMTDATETGAAVDGSANIVSNKSVVGSAVEATGQVVKGYVNGVWTTIKGYGSGIKTFSETGSLTDALGEVAYGYAAAVGSTVQGFRSAQETMANSKSIVRSIADSEYVSGITGAANDLATDAKALGNFVSTGITNYTSNVKSLVTGNFEAINWSSSAGKEKVKSSASKNNTLSGNTKYYLPSLGVGYDKDFVDKASPMQMPNPYTAYSPRLFGAPPQLTSLNDIRTLSADASTDADGPVGDFYLTRILQDAQVANFVVGRALFTGGVSTIFGTISLMIKYAKALKTYDIFGSTDGSGGYANVDRLVEDEIAQEAYINALKNDTGDIKYKVAENIRDLDDGVAIMDEESLGESKSMIDALANAINSAGGSETDSGSVNSYVDNTIVDGTVKAIAGISSALLTSLSVQQPFYTFEHNWHGYIENVKMMINTAVIMLGLQDACVRVGNEMIPLSLGQHYGKKEPWSMYSKWITESSLNILNRGSVTGLDTLTGDTSQYVSFMIDPAGVAETYQNEVGDSQIYSTVINQGADIGNEIAFLTNTSQNSIDDAIINIAGGAINAAESVLTNMTAGVGRFTAAIAGSFARTFVGNHTIYPQIFKSHTSTQSRDITIHLNASGGDPYSYLMDILVPYFFILGMVLPELTKNNASSYAFPPLVQCNIPGLWGTRLGMVTSVTVNKNQSGKDLSIHGYPLSVDITMTVTDLQHVLLTSPQDRASTFLNNHTMFDYIAVCAGVDKYRPNGAVRLTARLALMANTIKNIDSVIGNAVLSDFTSFVNRLTGNAQL